MMNNLYSEQEVLFSSVCRFVSYPSGTPTRGSSIASILMNKIINNGEIDKELDVTDNDSSTSQD